MERNIIFLEIYPNKLVNVEYIATIKCMGGAIGFFYDDKSISEVIFPSPQTAKEAFDYLREGKLELFSCIMRRYIIEEETCVDNVTTITLKTREY